MREQPSSSSQYAGDEDVRNHAYTLEKTQEQVAEAVGLEPGTISRIERGAKGMSIDSLLMFSEIYGVSTDYILKGDETMTPSEALLEELGALVQKYNNK